MRRADRIRIFCREIWKWFETHKRTLPWRDVRIEDETQRAYMVLVSEIMLQQTQVARVEVIFKGFLREFPTIHTLAEASNRDVLVAWRGMGYNSRAIRLRDAAREIVYGTMDDAVGQKRFCPTKRPFPRSMQALTSISGIGPYTAAAIRNFAFSIPTPCLDTNIRRILHRTFVGPENPDGTWQKDDRYLLELAEEIWETALSDGKHRAADWCAALMDYGSLVQRKTNPKWDQCVLAKAGICKAAISRVRVETPRRDVSPRRKREPGRLVGSTFIPNRIFRGRIIEALRNGTSGLTLGQLGPMVAIDWNPREHRLWLQKIVEKLAAETLIAKRGSFYVLPE